MSSQFNKSWLNHELHTSGGGQSPSGKRWRESLAGWILAGLASLWSLKSDHQLSGGKKLATTLIAVVTLFLAGCNDEDKNNGMVAPHLGKVYVEQTSPTSAKVTWQAATDDLTQPGEMAYEVHISPTANFKPDPSTRYTTVIGKTLAEITGLETGKKYYVLVVAVDKNGLQSGEREYQAVTLLNNPGLSATQLTIIHVTDPATDLGLLVTNAEATKQATAATNLQSFLAKHGSVEWTIQQSGNNLPPEVRTAAERICREDHITDPVSLAACSQNLLAAAVKVCQNNGVTESDKLKQCVLKVLSGIEQGGTKEVLALFGKKNQKGQLLSVSKMILTSETIPGGAIQISLGDNSLPTSMMFSDGGKAEFSNYSATGATMKYISPDGKVISEDISLPMDEINQAKEEITRYSQQLQQQNFTGENNVLCKEMVGAFLQATDRFVAATAKIVSGLGCAAAVASAIVSAGTTAPLALWACGSIVLNAMSEKSGNKDLKDITQVNDYAQTAFSCVTLSVGDCASGLGTQVYDILRKSKALSPESLCADPERGISSGDPHLYTFDNLAYDFQAVGEFILAKSTLPGNLFEVQARQQPWGDRTDVTINQAAAMNVGGDKVGFYLRQNPMARINGISQELAEGTTPLPKGGRIDKLGALYTVIWPDAHSMVEVRNNGWSYLTIKIDTDDFHKGQLIGLLGNADGNPQNDLTQRNGTPLGTKLEFATLYSGYADSWRVLPPESLFDYAPGETTETFTDRKFPRLFSKADRLPANVRAAAEQICRASGVTDPIVLEDCILDVALTGEAGFAASAAGLTGGQALEVTPPPPPVFGSAGFGQFQGLVYDGTSKQPLNGAPVRVTVNGTPLPSPTGHQTNAGGHYETDVVPTGVGYGLAIEVANYIAEQVFGLEVTDRKVRDVETINLVPAQFAGKLGNITGKVKNALDNQPLSNLTVNVRRYINNRVGGAIKTTQTDQSGNFKLEGLNSGNYTIELSGAGLITRYVTALSIAGQPTQVDVVMSPELGNALYRIVLTWNNATDLDAHLTGPNEQGGRFHVYFNVPGSSNAEEAPYAWLNRDDADGFGPETMSIFKLQQGVYRFSVHDYKNGTSTASRILADSLAKVDVYSRNGLVASFNVPNQEGTLWTVFEIDTAGVIWPVNAMGYEVKQGTLGTLDVKKPLSVGGSIEDSPVQTDYKEIVFQKAKP